MPMQMDLQGFVEGNLTLAPTAPQRCLLPLYEAVSNSIDAIQAAREAKQTVDGRIDILIHRDRAQGVMRAEDGQKIQEYPISGFTITDDGIGFDRTNFESFNTGFSRLKSHLGAKGRGRFMWLKAFDRVEVDSVFLEEGTPRRRMFTFTLRAGCEGGETPGPASGWPRKTLVKLDGMLTAFREQCPKHADAIAGHLVRRFVRFLVLPSSPAIFLVDSEQEGPVSLNVMLKQLKLRTERSSFRVKDKDFKLDHMLLRKQGELKHELHFCARRQAIDSELLDTKIPDLRAPITEGDAAAVYHGYVSSPCLDDLVNPERTDFDRPSDGQLPYGGAPPWQEIVDASVLEAARFLEPYTGNIRAAKRRRVVDYVQSQAPWYRHVVKQRPNVIEEISPMASQSEIDITLYRAAKEIEIELRDRASELLERGEAAEDPDDYRTKLEQFLEQYGDVGKDQLAKYVAHRKAILSFLFDRLKLRDDGKHHLEKDIHQVIFPMQATSDDVEADRMNLWIIDERLAFHYYLASDKPLRTVEPISIDSGKELDLLIFNRPFFFGDGDVDIGTAVIVEFKRPMTDDRNPIDQVYGYVRTVRSGTVTKDGRTLKVGAGTPFYAYILCDLTPKMREYAENAALQVSPDGEGYVGYNGPHAVYVEVISYQKAIADARKRNAILFQKLGLPLQLKKPDPHEQT